MSIMHLLNREALWLRNQPVGDRGKFVEHLVTVDPALPVRLQIASASERTVGFQQRAEATHIIFSEPDVELLRDDVLHINNVPGVPATTADPRYKVLTKEPPSKPEHHLRWTVQEQQESSGVYP